MNAAAQLGGSLDVRIQVRSFNAVCRMVGAGVGIGMVPNSSITIPQGDFLQGAVDGLKAVKINDAWAPRDLQLCVRSRSALSSGAAALFDHLVTKGSEQA
jgi:DNA-binding transcriptional LysR family regulator